MVLIRTVVRLIKPLWPSVAAQNLGSSQIRCPPGCSIIGNLDCHKRGIFGRCLKHEDPLIHFVGTWYQTGTENMEALLQESGLKQDAISEEMKRESWTTYTRDDDHWTCYYGILKQEGYNKIEFVMGQTFYDTLLDREPVKGIVFQRGDAMVQRFESVVDPPMVYEVERKIKDKNKHIAKIRLNNVVAKMKMKRIKSDEERLKIIGFLV